MSVVDVRDGVGNASVETVDFSAYDGREDELRERGVRVFGHVNNRNFDVDPVPDVEEGPADPADAGDLGPEGVTFVSRAESPVDDPLVAVANELSGTTTVYRVRTHHGRDVSADE